MDRNFMLTSFTRCVSRFYCFTLKKYIALDNPRWLLYRIGLWNYLNIIRALTINLLFICVLRIDVLRNDSNQDNKLYLEEAWMIYIWRLRSWRVRRYSATAIACFLDSLRSISATDRLRRSPPSPSNLHQRPNRRLVTSRLCAPARCKHALPCAISATKVWRLLSRLPRIA